MFKFPAMQIPQFLTWHTMHTSKYSPKYFYFSTLNYLQFMGWNIVHSPLSSTTLWEVIHSYRKQWGKKLPVLYTLIFSIWSQFKDVKITYLKSSMCQIIVNASKLHEHVRGITCGTKNIHILPYCYSVM
jgi:hypothetical protein